MKIALYYKDLLLGCLIKENDLYKFILNSKDFDIFKNKYFEGKLFPFKEKIQVSPILFPFFQKIIKNIKKRLDIILLANISQNDNDFIALYKYASITQNTFGYHLKQI